MNIVKRATAAVLVAIMVLSLASCHKKGAVVMSANGVKINSSLYLAMLIQANDEGRNKIKTEFTEAGKSTDDIDYFKQKIDKKSFETWVKDRTLESCYQYIVTEKQFKDLKLSLSSEDLSMLPTYLDYYWSYYGYSKLYEPNGVSKETFSTFYKNSAYERKTLFEYYYGKGGPKAVPEADIVKGLSANFTLADTISIKFSKEDGTTMTDDEKAAAKKKLDGYAKQIKDGKKNFDQIKAIYDAEQSAGTSTSSTSSTTSSASSASSTAADTSSVQSSSTSSTASSSTASTSSGSAEAVAKDPNATLYGGEATSSPSDYFSKINEMKKGAVSVFEFSDCYMLAVKKDVNDDPYYLSTTRSQVLNILKGDEFTKMLGDEGKKLKLDINKGEIGYLSPKKIVYPTSTNTAAGTGA